MKKPSNQTLNWTRQTTARRLASRLSGVNPRRTTIEAQGLYLEHVKRALEKAEIYLLLSISSSFVFVSLSFAKEVSTGRGVQYVLLGVSLALNPVLALWVVFILMYVSGALVSSNLHQAGRAIGKVEDGRLAKAALSYPSLLTYDVPLVPYLAAVAPMILGVVGLVQLHGRLQKYLWLEIMAYGFVLGYLGLLAELRRFRASGRPWN